MQLLNVFFGGSLHQDIVAIGKGHRYAHGLMYPVADHPLSWLTSVNSLHHQALRSLGFSGRTPHIIALDSTHGLTEIIAWDDNVLGVQFHPEMFALSAGDRFFNTVKDWVAGNVSMSSGLNPDSPDFDDEDDEDRDDEDMDDEDDDEEAVVDDTATPSAGTDLPVYTVHFSQTPNLYGSYSIGRASTNREDL